MRKTAKKCKDKGAFLRKKKQKKKQSLTVLLRHAFVVLVAVGVRADQLGAGAHDEGLVAVVRVFF
jgi:hypothetical protein